jgi:hypothetical protein
LPKYDEAEFAVNQAEILVKIIEAFYCQQEKTDESLLSLADGTLW